MNLSKLQNEVWLESQVVEFDEAVALGNYDVAEDLISKVADAGFSTEATMFATELAKAKEVEKLEDVKNDEIL